jgi:hypothetical protein
MEPVVCSAALFVCNSRRNVGCFKATERVHPTLPRGSVFRVLRVEGCLHSKRSSNVCHSSVVLKILIILLQFHNIVTVFVLHEIVDLCGDMKTNVKHSTLLTTEKLDRVETSGMISHNNGTIKNVCKYFNDISEYFGNIIIIIIISGSTVLTRTLAASHRSFRYLINIPGRTPLDW